YGSTKDALSGAGKGDDATSKGSSTLKAVDSTSQFLSGPTGDGKFGNSKQGTIQHVVETTNRASTLDAGNDLNILRPTLSALHKIRALSPSPWRKPVPLPRLFRQQRKPLPA
ncbi:Adhesin/hemagglutinin, HecA protein, partial [Pseudomonas syringae pv. maculicola]